VILRFVFSCCENHAIRPSWWNNLKDQHKEEIIDRAGIMVSPLLPVPSNYLTAGLEGGAEWEFGYVKSNM